MNCSIVPDSAGRGKSDNDEERNLINDSRVLAGWVRDTVAGLEVLQAWLGHLQQWRRQIVTASRF